MRTQVILTVAVSVLALGVRLHGLWRPELESPLGSEPERVAAALAAGRGWSDTFAAGTGPSAHVTPLYPLLLSGIYRLCGDYETSGGRVAQQALAMTLSLLVVLFLPVLARKLGLSAFAGWAAAFIKAVWISGLEIHGRNENVLATLSLLALIWCFADLHQRGWTGRGALARTGILLGLIALLCPNFLLVAALVLLGEWVLRQGERRQLFRCGVILALIGFLFVAPWLVRNYLVLGGFVPLRSNFGLELAVGNRPNADGGAFAPGFNDMHPLRSAPERERLVQMGELANMRDKQQQAMTWIRENPRRFAWLTWQRIQRTYFVQADFAVDVPLLDLRIPVSRLMALTTVLQLLWLLRREAWAGRLLICTFLGAGLPYFITHVEMRYRMPLTGLLLLLTINPFVWAALLLRGKWAEWRMPSLRSLPAEAVLVARKS